MVPYVPTETYVPTEMRGKGRARLSAREDETREYSHSLSCCFPNFTTILPWASGVSLIS